MNNVYQRTNAVKHDGADGKIKEESTKSRKEVHESLYGYGCESCEYREPYFGICERYDINNTRDVNGELTGQIAKCRNFTPKMRTEDGK